MHFARGLAYLDAENLPDAEASFKRAVEMSGTTFRHCTIWVWFTSVREGHEAEAAYLRVQELAPHMSSIEAVKHTTYDGNTQE